MSRTVRSMSMTAFAGRLGTLVEPTWLMEMAVSPMAVSMRFFARAKCSGHVGSGSTIAMGCLTLRKAMRSMPFGSNSKCLSRSSLDTVIMNLVDEKATIGYVENYRMRKSNVNVDVVVLMPRTCFKSAIRCVSFGLTHTPMHVLRDIVAQSIDRAT